MLGLLAAWVTLFLFPVPARAQLQHPFVFAVDPANARSIDVFTRNDLTGVLTPVAGSPFPSKKTVNVMTIDFKGRFLFTASYNPSDVSMFTIDPNTGALQEVANSPRRPPTSRCFFPRKAAANFCRSSISMGHRPTPVPSKLFKLTRPLPA
jgi:hypothetical protein